MDHARETYGAGRMGRIRRLHFIGIGGSGMSGIAEVMFNLGYEVSGSDQRESETTRRLASLGVKVAIGHDAGHAAGADAVVISTAIDPENPEVRLAKEQRLPIVPRAEMLAELMRFHYGIAVAGTHGKTTTTSLVASLLAEGGLDPTFVIGGRLNSAGTHARLGTSKYLVAEADESDASFLYLQPVMAVVTNIDADHMRTYGNDFSRLRHTFTEFLHHIPFYGLALLCLDDAEVRGVLPSISRPVRTYGTSPEADIRATEIRHEGLRTHFVATGGGIGGPLPITLNLPGHHNVLNALAAIGVAVELGVDSQAIQRGLSRFEGIGRRFQVSQCALPDGRQLTLVDDYAHHPREIAATLQAARTSWPNRRILVAFQPHRFSRTHEQFDDFVQVLSQVDLLLLAEVYPAGEAPIPGADGRSLIRAIRVRGEVDPVFVEQLDQLPAILNRVVRDGDLVMMLGAGDIGGLAARMCGILQEVAVR